MKTVTNSPILFKQTMMLLPTELAAVTLTGEIPCLCLPTEKGHHFFSSYYVLELLEEVDRIGCLGCSLGSQ